MRADPYASVERMIRLPKKHKLSDTTKLFDPINNTTEKGDVELSQPLLTKTNDLLAELNQTFEVYQNPKNYQFIFPDSMFPPVPENQTNLIRYEQKMITQQENTFKNRLSQEQLKEIEETGEFKVKSNIEYIVLPYVWKINENIFWGRSKIKKNWDKMLANIFGLFWNARRFMVNEIPKQLSILKSIPYSLFKLFFGKKSLQTMVSVDYDRELYKDFWNKILKENYEENQSWFNALWQYLYVYYDPEISRPIEDTKDREEYQKRQQKRNKLEIKYNQQVRASDEKISTIQRISQNFNQQWAKLRKRTIIEISEEFNPTNTSFQQRPESEEELLLKESKEAQEEETDKKILQKLAEKRFSLYLDHFKVELPKSDVPLDVVNAIVLILRLFSLISNRERKLSSQKAKRRSNIQSKIKQEFKIKSLFWPFLEQKVNQQMEPIAQSLQEEMFKNLPNDPQIATFLNKSQLQAYSHFLNLRSQFSTLIEAKKLQRPQYHGPTRVFYSNYRLLPPYQVIKHDNQYYSLKKVSDNLTVDTSKDFWKFRLYWMRLKTWTINSLVYLFMSVWKGPLGLRALWGVQDYRCGMNINSRTGEIYYQSTKTVLGTFKKVLEGINKSRTEFEEAPDLGLLGKNVSRIFNYIECYLFRFLFVGIILTLIGFPVFIILASTITFLLVVTFWAWMPLVLIVTYIFNTLIKQFETAKQQYGFMTRTFPLLRIALRFVGVIGMIIIAVLNLILWAPLQTAFWFTVKGAANGFRRILDKVMMFIFRHLGRTPSRDTLIAKKISGPGMSKEFYMSINQQDVYILVRANLERQFMQKLNELISVRLNEQGSTLSKIMGKILRPFGSYYNTRDQVRENYHQLLNNYNRQYRLYMNRYPNNPYNVRFTQQEIDSYFPNTVAIVQHFVDKFEIQSWIFEHHELYEGMYDELTRSIWMEIFGCGEEIFEPLQKLDARFKLEDQYQNDNDNSFNIKMKKGVGSVMKALQGEVNLSHHHKKLTPFKHNLLSRQLPSEQINIMFYLFTSNNRHAVNLNVSNPKTFFVPNLNIKEITIVENEERERNIKRQQFLVDL